jgi:copper(I)-binding protein
MQGAKYMRYLIALLMLVVGAWTVTAAEAAGSIAVERAWARASPKGAPNGVTYLTLVNNGMDVDRLVAASSPIAESIQFHEEKSEDGVSKMRQLETIDVPPDASVTLKPSGIHLMMKLKQQLQEGQSFPLTLTFEKAGAIEVTVKIGKVGAMDDMSGM